MVSSKRIPTKHVLSHDALRNPIGWATATGLAVIAAILRMIGLGHPKELIFDETYYVKDAYSLWKYGTERAWPEEPNPNFVSGNPMPLDDPGYVVHPPLGKWMLSVGQMIFGQDSSFGWRFSAAIVGALTVFIIVRLAIRLFGSIWMGFIAGLLLMTDGEHFVHSRTALLDLFLMFFVLLGFWLLVIDRDYARTRMVELTTGNSQKKSADLSSFGPHLGWRPWRLAAGVALGCAMGVKWSGLYALAVFGIMIVVWDVRNRYLARVKYPLRGMLVRDSVPAFMSLVPVAFVAYVLCWSGWIFTDKGYDRHWAQEHQGWWSWLPDWIPSLAHYHHSAYKFHVGLSSEHPYASNPWGWIVQWRPTSFYYRSPEPGQNGCDWDKCSAAITSVGNPALWGVAAIALVIVLLAWLVRQDWRAGGIIAGMVATWAPWFTYQDRTIFTFYTIVMVPFVVLAVTYCVGLVWGRGRLTVSLRVRRILVGVFLAVAVLLFAYFWPLYTGTTVPYESWRQHMFNPSWI
ncbi:dolichyl-phosphate-mannose--protein mannosyltransferase [Brevibacterium paucivorans]|uniref:Polyprenol-phosphate-mannose--protein mannosyltransferase n=1 Tax=Brevibacterium paucivorans TaxID=170994 RepID=A0A2N6VM51_9MICO|nr:phospholipid carrier-dependent glycosyltransferase [Brevibacterium paucivorans]PMD05196.1 phospholipid carrier-dependent glycosyltransferase [Brevibacterium paucivorans]